ncbi:hypothetical protein P3L10_028513 [Capsicum annuum]
MKKSRQNHVKKDKKKEFHGCKKRGSNSSASKASAKRRRIVEVIFRDELPKGFSYRAQPTPIFTMQSRCHITSSCWTEFPSPGEGQILTQVKQVVENGQGVPGFGRKKGDLFKHAITAGKRVRTDTNISNGSLSVSSAVVELIETSKVFFLYGSHISCWSWQDRKVIYFHRSSIRNDHCFRSIFFGSLLILTITNYSGHDEILF